MQWFWRSWKCKKFMKYPWKDGQKDARHFAIRIALLSGSSPLKRKKIEVSPFYVKKSNSYIITLCIFLKEIFLRNPLKKIPIKIRWKITSICTNNRNIHFCKRAGFQYPKSIQIYSVPRIIESKIHKDPNNMFPFLK